MGREQSYLKPGEVVHATGYRIKVEIDRQETKSSGGIIIEQRLSEPERKGAERGIIREVGPLCATAPGETLENWGVKVGNTVFFNRYGGYYYEDHEGNSFIMLTSEQELAGVIYPEETEENLKLIEENPHARA